MPDAETKTYRRRPLLWLFIVLAALIATPLPWSAVPQLLAEDVADSEQVDQRDQVARLLKAVEAARKRGDLQGASDAASKAVKLAEETLDSHDSNRIRAMLAAADLKVLSLVQAGDLEGALRESKQAVEIAATQTGEGQDCLAADDRDRVQSLLTLASVHYRLKQPQEALAAYERVLAVDGDEASLDALQHAEALVMAASVKISLKQWSVDDSAGLLTRLDELKLADPTWKFVAQEMIQLLHVWNEIVPAALGDLNGEGDHVDAALAKLQSDIDGFAAKLEEAGVDPDIARLGRMALAQKQFELRRLPHVRKMLRSMDCIAARDDIAPFFKIHYWNLVGLTEVEWANFAAAREAHQRAHELSMASGRAELVAVTLNNLGNLALRQGDYATAKRHLTQAVKIYSDFAALHSHPGRPYALLNLAKALEAEDEYIEARELLEEAMALVEASAAAGAAAQYAKCLCWAGLGVNSYNLGEFDAARESFEALAESVRKQYGEKHLHVAEADVNLGWLALAEERTDEAEARFRSALDIVEEQYGEDHPRVAEILSYLARVTATIGRREEATALLNRAMDLRERHLRRVLRTPLSERDRLAVVQELRVHPESIAWPGVLDTYLDLAASLKLSNKEQYERLLVWKGILARHALPQADELEDDPEVQELARQREAKLDELRSGYFALTTGQRADLSDLEAEINRLERELRRRSSRFAESGTSAHVTAEAVRTALPSGAALLDVIEIRRYQQRKVDEPVEENRAYLGFLVFGDGRIERVEFGPADPIDDSVRRFRDALIAEADIAPSAAHLDSLIRKPIVSLLKDTRLLIVAGDGLLHRLPLGALPGGRPGSYWIEDLAFASTPTADSLVARRGPGRGASRSADSLLIVGGVEYGKIREKWKPLPGTLKEARAVSQVFRNGGRERPVRLLTGADATEQQVLEGLAQARFVHLATHGFFMDTQSAGGFDVTSLSAQLDSGLVMAEPEKDARARDQFLTSAELSRLNLRHVDLAVLSACETGLGAITSGQGLVGLISALDQAGVRATLSSLWPVDDEATLLLMREFYHELWSSQRSPSEALRTAQLKMLRGETPLSGGRSARHPKYWAPFVLSGDPGG